MSFFYLCSCLSTQFLYRTAVKATFNVKDNIKDIIKITIGMVLYAKGNYTTEYLHRIYKNICSKATFQSAIKELVKYSFIEMVSSGKFNHRPNEYKFCDKWHNCNKNNN